MSGVNAFNFANYDKGGKNAIKGDGRLTGEEIYMAANDGWTVWDGFESNDKAMRTKEAIDRLFSQVRANNTPSMQDNRPEADADYLSWAVGRFNTEDVSEVITRGDTTILKRTYEFPMGEPPKVKWVEVTDTYIIKDNNDGTTDITYQGWDGVSKRTLIDNRAGKEMVEVSISAGQYNLSDKTTGQSYFNKLGDFVKNLRENSNNEIRPKTNKILDVLRYDSIDITF